MPRLRYIFIFFLLITQFPLSHSKSPSTAFLLNRINIFLAKIACYAIKILQNTRVRQIGDIQNRFMLAGSVNQLDFE